MQSDIHVRAKHPWWKDLMIGVLSWLAAFLLYMLPSLAVGISMGIDLGPKLHDGAEVSRRIGQKIGEMYQSGWYFHLGFIIVLGCIVYWRSSIRTKQFEEKSILHGITIGTTAAILVIIQMMSHGVGVYMIIGALICVVAGAVGGQQWKVSQIGE